MIKLLCYNTALHIISIRRSWPLGAPPGRPIGSHGSDPGFLRKPQGLAFDSAGKLWWRTCLGV